MLPLIIQTIRKSRNSLLTYLAINGGMVWMLIAIFPSFAQKAEEMSKAFANYPEAMMKAFNIDMSQFLTSPEGFLAGENFSFMWPILLIILTISFGSAAIAGEIEKGTIEILLAQPLSRIRLFLGKYAAGLLVTLTFVIVSVFSVVPFALLHGVTLKLENYATICVLGAFLGVAFFSMAMMFSSLFSERGKAASLMSGILIVSYALNLVASLKESLDKLKYLSLFHYFDQNAALLRNELDLKAVAVFLSVSLICTLIGLAVFVKRDVAV